MRRPLGILLPILILIVWEIAARSINNQFILPKMETVIPVLLTPTVDILGTGSLLHNAMVSLERVGAGFLVAFIFSLLMAAPATATPAQPRVCGSAWTVVAQPRTSTTCSAKRNGTL